jgi:hypothetical protein
MLSIPGRDISYYHACYVVYLLVFLTVNLSTCANAHLTAVITDVYENNLYYPVMQHHAISKSFT